MQLKTHREGERHCYKASCVSFVYLKLCVCDLSHRQSSLEAHFASSEALCA